MKTTLLEWYDKSLTEANLGMNSKIKKKYQGKTVEDEVEKLGTYVDLSNKNQQEIIAALIEQAKAIYGSSENIKLTKSWNQVHTTANMSISFKPYVDRMNIAFSPRLFITVRENTYTEVSLDFRIDTSGSGSFHSRLITIVTGFAEKMSEEIINSMFNVKKLNVLDGDQYPPEWSKKQYTIFVAGFDTSDYVPPKVASPEFTSKTIDEWIMLPRYWNENFFNYDKALEDMFGQDIEYTVCKFKKLTRDLEPYVKYKRRYRQELEGNIVKAMVIIHGKVTKEIVHELSLRLFVYKDPSYKEFFINVNSYYRLEDCGGITIPEEDPKLEELVSKVEVNSDMFTEVKNKIVHYISSNKNSTIVKNVKKRILSILDKKNKELKESNLGLNNKVKKKFNDVDAVENVSQIPFEDPEVERVCHKHGVYTVDDARDVTNIKGWFTANEKIKTFNELKFFTGLKTIEEQAFECCSSLQSINIPNSVSSIGNRAFVCCSSLQSVTIPDSVTSIGTFAFKECTSLQSITIPNSVTIIGRVTFMYCEALQSINIPDGITIIEGYAFAHCKSLQTVTIPNSVNGIREYAFLGCKSLQSINIPDSVIRIGNGAFYECTSLQSINIPDGVIGIGIDALGHCKSLHSIYISKNRPAVYNQIKNQYPAIKLIEPKVNEASNLGLNNKVKKKFDKVDAVDNVSQIHFEDPEVERICHEHGVYTIDDAARVDSIGGWFEKNETIKSFNEFRWFTGIKTIERQAFSGCTALQSVTIPNSVTYIGGYAFALCKSLQSIDIPDSVTNIKIGDFYGCTSLQSINIPNSVTNIGIDAFYGCTSLQSVTIPNSVIGIGMDAFKNCKSLHSIYISKNHPGLVYNQIKNQYPDILLIEPKVNESSNLGLNSKVKKKFGVETLEDTAEEIAHDFSTVKSTMSAILTETIKRAPDNWWCWHGYNMKIIQLITPIFDGRIHRDATGIMEIIPYGNLDKDRLTLQIHVNDEDASYQLKDNDIGANKNAFDNCMSILFNFTEYVMDEETNVGDNPGFEKFIRKNEDQLALMSDINKRTVIVDLLDSFGLLD